MPLATNCRPVVDNEFTCFPNTPFIVYVILMEHTKSNDCYTNMFGCESQVNIILLEFRSGWLSVSSSLTALASSSKIITNMDFRDLSFERISFLLYLCSNRRSPLGLRELKLRLHARVVVAPSVAARLGCVNWNQSYQKSLRGALVAARLGCVNWNSATYLLNLATFVAARLGCVNWNLLLLLETSSFLSRSPLGLRELKHPRTEHRSWTKESQPV